jgi:hypothetical protein
MADDTSSGRSEASDAERREFLTKRLLPAATVVGAFGVAGVALLRPGTPRAVPKPSPEPAAALPAMASTEALPHKYTRVAVLVGPGTAGEFRRSLTGLTVGPGDSVFVLGDDEVRAIDPSGTVSRAWSVAKDATCIGVAADGRVAVGARGRVDVFDAAGARVGGFTCGATDKPSAVTAVRLVGDEVLVADAAARVIRRYDRGGRELGLIGALSKTGGFMLPNRSLDFDVDAAGTVYAADAGRHRVSSWTLDGAPIASFGKFGMAKLEDFVGCCNPVNVAVAADGSVVTAEKAISRVKVFGADRSLLAVIGPEHFDPTLVHIHVAVDSSGRILAADPVRRTVAVFQRS